MAATATTAATQASCSGVENTVKLLKSADARPSIGLCERHIKGKTAMPEYLVAAIRNEITKFGRVDPDDVGAFFF
jgi:hypothetical protein